MDNDFGKEFSIEGTMGGRIINVAVESERKFLVDRSNFLNHSRSLTDAKLKLVKERFIRQGYLLFDPEVRIRTTREMGTDNIESFITIKTAEKVLNRQEFESSINNEDAKNLLESQCLKHQVAKMRTSLFYCGIFWEVDRFFESNSGLIIAEVEIRANYDLERMPTWITKEVTEDPKYYNANLARKPYKTWD